MSHAPKHPILDEIACRRTYIVTTKSIEEPDRQAVALRTSLYQGFSSTRFGFEHVNEHATIKSNWHHPALICSKKDEHDAPAVSYFSDRSAVSGVR